MNITSFVADEMVAAEKLLNRLAVLCHFDVDAVKLLEGRRDVSDESPAFQVQHGNNDGPNSRLEIERSDHVKDDLARTGQTCRENQ